MFPSHNIYIVGLFCKNKTGYSKMNIRKKKCWNNLNHINKIIQRHSCNSLLDYGCGKAFLYSKKKLYNKLIKKIFLYDPYYFRFIKKPRDIYDITICTDVMEHIKKKDINKVIKNISHYTRKVIFFSISTVNIVCFFNYNCWIFS